MPSEAMSMMSSAKLEGHPEQLAVDPQHLDLLGRAAGEHRAIAGRGRDEHPVLSASTSR
jgi:hypothetical protein